MNPALLELQSQRGIISKLREEKNKLTSDLDGLQALYDNDVVYDKDGWRKEKERMETKIKDMELAYDASTSVQADQQSQIVALHGQVRELRAVLDEAEADRSLLQKARRALQAELETIKMDHVDSGKISADHEFQRLNLQKQDLERSLEEHEDRVSTANERLQKAQNELDRVRIENSSLEKYNVSRACI